MLLSLISQMDVIQFKEVTREQNDKLLWNVYFVQETSYTIYILFKIVVLTKWSSIEYIAVFIIHFLKEQNNTLSINFF